jgi:hypothetical protein
MVVAMMMCEMKWPPQQRLTGTALLAGAIV